MGLFGKIFDKKECSVCGGEIGLLGNRKLEDGNCCKECAKKLSPWFEERRHSTVEDIRNQLEYREANKQKVRLFRVTREIVSDTYHVFIDDNKSQFAIARSMDEETNPDILDLSQITGCNLSIERHQEELRYQDKEGNWQDFNPPRYKNSYIYSIKLAVNSPWFNDMDFDLNTFEVEEHERMKLIELENTGNQIVEVLTGNVYQPQMNMPRNGMYGQQMNMPQNGMYGQQMNMPQNGMYGQQMNMPQNGMYGQQMNMLQNGMYGQQINMPQNGMYGQQVNMPQNGMYGQQINMPQNGMYDQQMNMPQNGMYDQQMNMPQNGMHSRQSSIQDSDQALGICCSRCGWVPDNMNTPSKFCPMCGNPLQSTLV